MLGERRGAGQGIGRGPGGGVGRSSGFRLFIRRRVTFHPPRDRTQGGEAGGGKRKGSVANVFVTASICRPASCVSRTTSSNLISKGTRQCPGNLFLLNHFFSPAALLFDQTSFFYDFFFFYKITLLNCHIHLRSLLPHCGLDWIVNSGLLRFQERFLRGSRSLDSIAAATLAGVLTGWTSQFFETDPFQSSLKKKKKKLAWQPNELSAQQMATSQSSNQTLAA